MISLRPDKVRFFPSLALNEHFNVAESIERIIGSSVFAFSAADGVSAAVTEKRVVAVAAENRVTAGAAVGEDAANSRPHGDRVVPAISVDVDTLHL